MGVSGAQFVMHVCIRWFAIKFPQEGANMYVMNGTIHCSFIFLPHYCSLAHLQSRSPQMALNWINPGLEEWDATIDFVKSNEARELRPPLTGPQPFDHDDGRHVVPSKAVARK
jgi:hypothetical protein